MRTRHLAALVVVVCLFALSGCSKDNTVTTGSSSGGVTVAELDGKSFVSTEVTGHTLVPGSQIAMSFENGTLRATAGCNSIGGNYTIENSILEGGDNFSSTLMGCDADLSAQDQWLSGFLGAAPTLAIDGDTLTMTAKGATITMNPEAATPARPLVGPTWTLETITDGQTASSVPTDVQPSTLRIDADGTAAVFTGCNNGSASTVVTDTSLTFGPMRLTKMACAGDAKPVERAVVAMLDGEVAYSIDGTQLNLTKGDQGLVYRAP